MWPTVPPRFASVLFAQLARTHLAAAVVLLSSVEDSGVLADIDEALGFSQPRPPHMVVCRHGTEGCHKLLSQLHPEGQHTSLHAARLSMWHNEVLHHVRVVDGELKRVIQNAPVRTERLPGNAIVFEDGISQVHSSHVSAVVVEERRCGDIDRADRRLTPHGVVSICVQVAHFFTICSILRDMPGHHTDDVAFW